MLIEDKTLWLEALRSGKYRQTTGFLKVQREGKYNYCCIGVLCEILKDKYEISEGEGPVTPGLIFFDDNSDSLTSKLMSTLELDSAQVNKLYSLNDVDRWSFDHIADWIEVHVQVTPEETAETTNA